MPPHSPPPQTLPHPHGPLSLVTPQQGLGHVTALSSPAWALVPQCRGLAHTCRGA